MKVARLYRFGDIRIEEEPIPEVSEGEALIKTRACGICTGDVMPWYIEKKAPIVLGHEPAGEIVKVGKGVKNFREGDRVFVHHHAPCMNCRYCLRGNYVQCEAWRASKIIPGGISEYILVPELNLKVDTLRLPDKMSFEAATLIEPTACVVKSLKRSLIKEGDTLLVIGLGIMGMLHIALARHYGAHTIIGADRVPYRLKKALEAGADHAIDVNKEDLKEAVYRITGGRGPEIVIVGPSSIQAMEVAIETVGRGGTVVFFTPSPPGETLSVEPNYLYFRDINLVNSYSCGPEDTREAMRLIETGLIEPDKFITHKFPIEETPEAYNLVAKAEESLKVVVLL
jgi:L-iditol 2-dehydrogenase